MPFEIAEESEHEIAHERASFEKAPPPFLKARVGDSDPAGSSFAMNVVFGCAFFPLRFSLLFSGLLKKSMLRRTVEKLGNSAGRIVDAVAI